MKTESVRLLPAALEQALAALFAAEGCGDAEAGAIANHLVGADLAGHPSHGSSLTPIYLANLRAGLVRPGQRPEAVATGNDFLLFDGGRGFGQWVGSQAIDRVTEVVAARGTAIFALRDVHHLGRIGAYGERLAQQGIVSALFVNTVSRPIVAPHGGAEARMGTNPVCITVPRGETPVVLDFATSAIAVGKARVAMEAGEALPPGVAIDAAGQPTTDPGQLYASPSGALLPLGGYKGWGLNVVCELLSACIGGSIMAGERPAGMVSNNLIGMAFKLDQRAATPLEETITYCLETRPMAGDVVRLPGDPERASRVKLQAAGLPMAAATWASIAELCRAAGLAPALLAACRVGSAS